MTRIKVGAAEHLQLKISSLTEQLRIMRKALEEIRANFAPTLIPMSEYATGYKDALRAIAAIADKGLREAGDVET